ncbi:MAG TPA: phage portal protein [Pirellulaceae bacterium]|nr:phage portal protein [Pirellulaceae bacterium]
MFGSRVGSVNAATQSLGPGVEITVDELGRYLRAGHETASGAVVTTATALQNAAVWRSVDLIASTIGALPLAVMRRGADGSITEAEDHPLYERFMYEPNGFQTPFGFKSMMQAWALTNGNAYAVIVRSGDKIIALNPLHPERVKVEQGDDLRLTYTYHRKDGGRVVYSDREIFHLRGLTLDGVSGVSRVHQAREAIGLAMRTEEAAARLFKNGQLVGGTLTHPGKLSAEARARLVADMQSRYAGAENSGKWLVLEEGMNVGKVGASASELQHVEQRKMQVEEIARVFGVPRPLLMVDETSWGSGVEQLATLFVRFGLAPWFRAWEDAITRSLIPSRERRTLYANFDETELLRGTMKDQGEFFAKALGAGGHSPFLTVNEVREGFGYGPEPGGDTLKNPMTTAPAAPVAPPAPIEDPSP